MESKLNKLLAPLEKDEQSLMKLDAIFAVWLLIIITIRLMTMVIRVVDAVVSMIFGR